MTMLTHFTRMLAKVLSAPAAIRAPMRWCLLVAALLASGAGEKAFAITSCSGWHSDAFWTGCLTIGAHPGNVVSADGSKAYGYGDGFGALTNKSFQKDGVSYTIDRILSHTQGDRTALDRSITSILLSLNREVHPGRWILQIGSNHYQKHYHLREEHHISAGYYEFILPLTDWVWNDLHIGDKIPVSLRCEDCTSPKLIGVDITSTPNSGTGTPKKYGFGDKIEITATFDEAVYVKPIVRPSIKLPYIPITLSENPPRIPNLWKQAFYGRGSGTRRLVFGFFIREALRDDDGIAIAENSFVLSELTQIATIRDKAGHDADLSHPALPSQAGHRVDGRLSGTSIPKILTNNGVNVISTPNREVGRKNTVLGSRSKYV